MVTPVHLAKVSRTALSKAKSYQEFLRTYFEETKLSYAEVARRSGFSSRSYPRDLTENRRRLTSKSLPALIRGLRLDTSLTQLFQALYFKEFPEEYAGQVSRSGIDQWIHKARKRTLTGPIRFDLKMDIFHKSTNELPILAEAFTEVLAALGEPEIGATLDEVRFLTGRKKEELSQILGRLEAEGVVNYWANTCHYTAKSGHLNLTGVSGNQFASAVFQSAVKKLHEASLQHFSREDALFMTSAVSVKKADLPRLKKEMRELILKFVDRRVETSSSPDTVIHLVNAVFESSLARK